MIEVLAIIEAIYEEFIDDGGHSHHKYKVPFAVLDGAQHAFIVLQNLLFAESTKLDTEIKTQYCIMVTNHTCHEGESRAIHCY
jgi:hypothetical protein